MMFRSLYSKLAAVLLVLFFIVGITFVLASVYSTEMYQQEVNQKLNRELAKLIVADNRIIEGGEVNNQSLKNLFHMLMVINPSIEVYLLDTEGNILAFSADPGKVIRRHVNLSPLRTFLDGETAFPLLGDDPRNPEGKKVFTAARIPQTGKLEGYLYVILGGEIYDSVIQKIQGSHIFRMTTWAVSASIVAALLTGLILFSTLTRRLRRLSNAIDEYKGGVSFSRLDLPSTGEGRPSDEIETLISTFREMAQQIEKQVESLKKADGLRRELVANISHDLRTPLATLQGYMETLLMKNTSLSEEERKTYLETAISHCNRLSKLVSGLFELAKLEAKDMQIHIEPFSMSELVQDVTQKFHLSAKEKKINIITNIEKEFPFVSADIGLIERVLENLLDNALRHTPDEGSVSVLLDTDGKYMTVRVSDTGYGIPAEDLPRIFDRFYQLDKSRKDRAGHSGLGLAITKRIVELHNSKLEVTSKLNEGTSFTFTLPVYVPK
jgi:signal transduction histidine kinase